MDSAWSSSFCLPSGLVFLQQVRVHRKQELNKIMATVLKWIHRKSSLSLLARYVWCDCLLAAVLGWKRCSKTDWGLRVSWIRDFQNGQAAFMFQRFLRPCLKTALWDSLSRHSHSGHDLWFRIQFPVLSVSLCELACLTPPTFYYSTFHRETDIIYLQDSYEDYMRSVLLTEHCAWKLHFRNSSRNHNNHYYY